MPRAGEWLSRSAISEDGESDRADRAGAVRNFDCASLSPHPAIARRHSTALARVVREVSLGFRDAPLQPARSRLNLIIRAPSEPPLRFPVPSCAPKDLATQRW